MVFLDGTTRGLFRKDWLLALEVPGPARDLFWDQREHYGFVNNPDHPEQMLVGFGWAGNYLTGNCAACHTSFIEYEGEMLIIPGGANRRAVGGGGQAYYALADTLLQPGSLARFATRVLGEGHSRADRKALRAEMERDINAYLSNTFTAVSGIQVEGYAKFHAINTPGGVMSWVRDEAGQFGSHPFIVGQNLWMGAQNFNPVLPTTDIPCIYDLEYLNRLHYNGNTNSVPTLYHLLLPSDQRLVTYTGGSYSFDAEYVGIEWDTEPSLADGTFTYDSSKPGAALSGHDYGTEMTDAMRRELLEYLKSI